VDSSETDRQYTVSRRFQFYLDKLGLSRPSELPLEEIWEQHIMTNFEQNWDYFKHKPTKDIKPFEE